MTTEQMSLNGKENSEPTQRRLTFKVNVEVANKLDAYAKEMHINRTAALCIILMDFFKRHEIEQ